MRPDWFDILIPPLGALAFLLYSWVYGRSIRGGKPFTPFMRGATVYGSFFILGIGYVMLVGAMFRWPHPAWFTLIAAWGALLLSVAWWRYRRARAVDATPRRPISATLAESLPMAGLLICLIGSAIEWESVVERQGHLIVALLWTGGVAASIWLARRNRRATVVVALRAFLGMLVVGAIAQQSVAVLGVVGFVGIVLLLLERRWKKEEPPGYHLTLH